MTEFNFHCGNIQKRLPLSLFEYQNWTTSQY